MFFDQALCINLKRIHEKLAYVQIWHLKIFQTCYSMLVLSTFRFTFSVLLARKWYLSALLFRTIFSNHWNKEIEDSSRDSITSSKFFPETCGVLSPLKFAMLIAFNVKKNPLRYWITAFLKQIIVVFQIQF